MKRPSSQASAGRRTQSQTTYWRARRARARSRARRARRARYGGTSKPPSGSWKGRSAATTRPSASWTRAPSGGVGGHEVDDAAPRRSRTRRRRAGPGVAPSEPGRWRGDGAGRDAPREPSPAGRRRARPRHAGAGAASPAVGAEAVEGERVVADLEAAGQGHALEHGDRAGRVQLEDPAAAPRSGSGGGARGRHARSGSTRSAGGRRRRRRAPRGRRGCGTRWRARALGWWAAARSRTCCGVRGPAASSSAWRMARRWTVWRIVAASVPPGRRAGAASSRTGSRPLAATSGVSRARRARPHRPRAVRRRAGARAGGRPPGRRARGSSR